MKRKLFLVALLAAFAVSTLTTNAFAQASAFRPSVGLSGYFTNDFGGGSEYADTGVRQTTEYPFLGGGASVFFDAQFLELSVGFFFGNQTRTIETVVGTTTTTINRDFNTMGIDIGVLGKYPIGITHNISVFPLIGARYRMVLSADADHANDRRFKEQPDRLNAFWFQAGAGMDLELTDSLFLRFAALYGIRLANAEAIGQTNPVGLSSTESVDRLLGHGLDARVGIGYRF